MTTEPATTASGTSPAAPTAKVAPQSTGATPQPVVPSAGASFQSTVLAWGAGLAGKAKQGTWQELGYQAAQRTKPRVLKVLKGRVSPMSYRAIASFLETDFGMFVYALIAGTAFGAIPMVRSRPNYARLASEMQIYGFQSLARSILNPLGDVVTEVFGEILSGAPSLDDV